MIKIYIEGESPLATLADLVATAHYFGGSPAVSAAARNVIAADEKSLGLMARRDTNSVEVVNLGSQPRHHAPDPDSDSGQHIFITQREENPSGGGTAQNPNQAPPAPGVVPNQNLAAPNGYPGNGNAQNPPPNGGYGNMNQPNGGGFPNNGNGYVQNPQSGGVPGVAQGNPTPGMSGVNPAMTTQTSLFNGQSATHPGPGSVPVTGAPTFTVAQVGKAGADLVTANPAKRNELNALLQQYGVQSVSELRPEQLAHFAQALRGMGANI